MYCSINLKQVYKKRMTTGFRKPEAKLRYKIKVRHKSGSALVAIPTQVIRRCHLELMKHSTKETFSKYLCQKLTSSDSSEPCISIRQGQEGRKVLNIRTGNRPWNPERF